MKLIVGLGNPGGRYARTRHNVGFDTVELLAERLGVAWDTRRSQSLIATATVMQVITPPKPKAEKPRILAGDLTNAGTAANGTGATDGPSSPAVATVAPPPPAEPITQPEKTLLVKPQTFMNDSGVAISDLVRFYKVSLRDLLVICDDLDSPLGRLRLRERGAAGGQHGLESTIRMLASSDFPRLRIGVGRPTRGRDANVDFLLTAPRGDDRITLDAAIARAAEAALIWATQGAQAAMNQFNG
ncbi:MAG TPA: aminoacyl-tRNA hydrolase [Ktedonobacterales bacterium]|nr:aminoacyl-tRNA hydrolase [Ktedonobacterales bacterium]